MRYADVLQSLLFHVVSALQGRCAQVVKEMKKYDLSILEVNEMRWNTFGSLRTAAGGTILYSGNPNVDNQLMKGVGLILPRVAADSLLAWEPVSERIITARFVSKRQNMSIIQVYAPAKKSRCLSTTSFKQQARSQDFAWGGAHERPRHEISSAASART